MRTWMRVLPGLSIFLSPQLIASPEVVGVAGDLGITPESLVMAGFENQDGEVVLSQLEAAVALRVSLANVKSQTETAATQVTSLAGQVLLNPGDEALQLEHQAAVGQLATLEAELDQLQGELSEVALEGFAADRLQRLAVWRSGSPYRVPDEFRVLERTDAQWRQIEVALRAEKRAVRVGEDLAPAHAALLSDIRLHPAVIEANMRLLAHLAEMEAVFDQHFE